LSFERSPATALIPTSGPEDRTLTDNKHTASLHYSGKLSLQPQEGFDPAITRSRRC